VPETSHIGAYPRLSAIAFAAAQTTKDLQIGMFPESLENRLN
jgi:hypothetical protein